MLINRIFNGNDAVYGLTVNAVDEAVKEHGADKPVGFPHTAYCLPCYYAVTGVKVKTLGELKEALGVVKTLMTRNHELDDALMSGVATALCAEFIEALKYLDGAEPYSEPCYGHLADSIIRELGVPPEKRVQCRHPYADPALRASALGAERPGRTGHQASGRDQRHPRHRGYEGQPAAALWQPVEHQLGRAAQ